MSLKGRLLLLSLRLYCGWYTVRDSRNVYNEITNVAGILSP